MLRRAPNERNRDLHDYTILSKCLPGPLVISHCASGWCSPLEQVRREVIEGQDGRFLRLRIFIATWRRDAVLGIMANFGMTGGTICAARWIAIIDTDFNPLGSEGRKSKPSGGQTAPVRIRIEDDVFLG
jgi:hypothetical protein